jgi:hypothetical protein
MNETTAVDLTSWVGKPIAEASSGLAGSGVEVLARPQEAGPFGPLATLASGAVRVFSGDQVIALVTAGRVAGFQPAPTGIGGLNHRVAVLERQVAELEAARAPATKPAGAARGVTVAKVAGAVKKSAPEAKKAPVKKAPVKKAPAKKAPAKKAPSRRGQG